MFILVLSSIFLNQVLIVLINVRGLQTQFLDLFNNIKNTF